MDDTRARYQGESLDTLRAPPRPMWQALAHQLLLCRPGDPRLPLLNRLYIDQSPGDKLRTLAELHACRTARRIEMLGGPRAVVRLPGGSLV